MKKVILFLSIALVAMLSLSSCQDDNHRLESPEIKLEKTELSLTSLGAKETIKVLAGVGEMTVTSSDESVAIVTITDNVITVTAKGVGEAIITVKTAEKEKSFKVVITSPALSVKLDKVAIAPKASVEVAIVGGTAPFTVKSSDEAVTTAEVKDGKVVITAKATKGAATITLKDASGKTATIEATIETPELSIEQGKEEITLADKGQVEIAIASGTEPVSVVSSDESKATAEIKDGKVVIIAKAEDGTATITMTDANGKTATIKVTLAPAPELTFDKMKDDKGRVEFILGDSEANRTITITGGTAPFLIIQEDTSSWSDPKSSVANITLDKKEELDSYGTKYQCKAGSFTGNKITFDAQEPIFGDTYIVRDAAGKEVKIKVYARKTLEVSKTTYEVLVGQTINDTDKIKVSGLAERFSIKSNSNEAVVEASIAESNNETDRALVLKGLSEGKSTLTITDGVVEKSVEVTVVAPKPITLYKEDGTALVDGTAYELSKFIIKGGTGAYEVTFDSDLIKKPVKATEISYGSNKGNFEFSLERNINVAKGGEVMVTVTNTNNPADKKTFKVTCPTLLEMTITVNGKPLRKGDSGDKPYYKINDGMYAGYMIYNVKVDDKIVFTVKNGSAGYKVVKDSGWGSDKIELTENGENTTFTLTPKKSGTYYGDVTITDKADTTKIIKITRIEIQ